MLYVLSKCARGLKSVAALDLTFRFANGRLSSFMAKLRRARSGGLQDPFLSIILTWTAVAKPGHPAPGANPSNRERSMYRHHGRLANGDRMTKCRSRTGRQSRMKSAAVLLGRFISRTALGMSPDPPMIGVFPESRASGPVIPVITDYCDQIPLTA